MPKYEDMTLKELDEKFLELRTDKAEIKKEMLRINEVREEKVDVEKVKEKINSLTDKERSVASQILGAQGIESKEAVGKPGAK